MMNKKIKKLLQLKIVIQAKQEEQRIHISKVEKSQKESKRLGQEISNLTRELMEQIGGLDG